MSNWTHLNRRVNADKKKELELLKGNLNNTFTIPADPKDTDEMFENSKVYKVLQAYYP